MLKGNKNLYLFVDVETTGLNYTPEGEINKNQMLQIAYKLYDNIIETELASDNFLVDFSKEELEYHVSRMNDYVKNMHTETGLIKKLQERKVTVPVTEIDNHIDSILNKYPDYKIIIAGNNVAFDKEVVRRYLPKTFKHLHYGLLDVTSVRRVFATLNSDFGLQVQSEKYSNHDALVDIEECVKEYKVFQKVMQTGLAYH